MAELILNKDFGLTVAASIFTGIGLGQNDLAQMIGGMLISPLAKPIMNSIMVGDVMMNMIKLLIMVLTCVVIGIFYFMVYAKDGFTPTERMVSIANPEGRGYLSDVIYGLVAGMVVYASHGGGADDFNILAGLAVGVTILPAFVNAGIMFGAGMKGYRDPLWNKNLSVYGLTSSLVGIIYLVCIVIGFLTAKTVNEQYRLRFE
jgi:Domain of unknown function (DUF389)